MASKILAIISANSLYWENLWHGQNLSGHKSGSGPLIVNSYGQFTPPSFDTNISKFPPSCTWEKLRRDMRSHPKKWQLVKPDAAPRGDSSYIVSYSNSTGKWSGASYRHVINNKSLEDLQFGLQIRLWPHVLASCAPCDQPSSIFPSQGRKRGCHQIHHCNLCHLQCKAISIIHWLWG